MFVCAGYDMDYTCIHYDVNAWEGKAYKCALLTYWPRKAGRKCVLAQTCAACAPGIISC